MQSSSIPTPPICQFWLYKKSEPSEAEPCNDFAVPLVGCFLQCSVEFPFSVLKNFFTCSQSSWLLPTAQIDSFSIIEVLVQVKSDLCFCFQFKARHPIPQICSDRKWEAHSHTSGTSLWLPCGILGFWWPRDSCLSPLFSFTTWKSFRRLPGSFSIIAHWVCRGQRTCYLLYSSLDQNEQHPDPIEDVTRSWPWDLVPWMKRNFGWSFWGQGRNMVQKAGSGITWLRARAAGRVLQIFATPPWDKLHVSVLLTSDLLMWLTWLNKMRAKCYMPLSSRSFQKFSL